MRENKATANIFAEQAGEFINKARETPVKSSLTLYFLNSAESLISQLVLLSPDMNNDESLASELIAKLEAAKEQIGEKESKAIWDEIESLFNAKRDVQCPSTANRNMIATAGGTAVGALTSVTAMGLVSTFATASTGTAISALSGAAATNATLAWFGGGAIAAGGGGTALGATVLTGGTAAIVIAAGAGIMYVFHLDDENTERERVAYLIQSIQEHLHHPTTQH